MATFKMAVTVASIIVQSSKPSRFYNRSSGYESQDNDGRCETGHGTIYDDNQGPTVLTLSRQSV